MESLMLLKTAKSKEIKNNVKDILSMVIEDGLSDKNLFNFYKSKK